MLAGILELSTNGGIFNADRVVPASARCADVTAGVPRFNSKYGLGCILAACAFASRVTPLMSAALNVR